MASDLDTSKWYSNFEFDRAGEISIELSTGFYYPVRLLGVDIPRLWAGNKDSCYFYSDEAHQYLRQLIKGASLKVTAGKEQPEHKFGKYYGYITAKTNNGIIEVNHKMLASGNATFSKYNRQQQDSILSFKLTEQQAKDKKLGMWAFPDSVNMKILTPKAKQLQNIFPLDINDATMEDLTFIPGIGPKTAKTIIDYRAEYGEIKDLDELLKIKGIGPATLEKLKQYLIIE